MNCAPNVVTVVTRWRRVVVAHTPATTNASARPVTMAADYVTSATVRASVVAMTTPGAMRN